MMKTITRSELFWSIFIVITISYALIFILIEQHRGFIDHALNIANALIIIQFIILLRYPTNRIQFKIEIMDKIISFMTKFNLAFSSLVTLIIWDIANEKQTSILTTIADYDYFYYLSVIFVALNSIYSLFKNYLLKTYSKNKIQYDYD
ncbi:hypothetical protein GKR59_14750 [Providencia alcalifaciens]|nr:hypothetical protein [Providencia sp. PROV208]MTC50884.1 hypothetical protein [Providencia alcalifaciens]